MTNEDLKQVEAVNSLPTFRLFIKKNIAENRGAKEVFAVIPIIMGLFFVCTAVFTDRFSDPGVGQFGSVGVIVCGVVLIVFGLYSWRKAVPQFFKVTDFPSSKSTLDKRGVIERVSERLDYRLTSHSDHVIVLTEKSSFPHTVFIYIDDHIYAYYVRYYELSSQAGNYLDLGAKQRLYDTIRRYIYTS